MRTLPGRKLALASLASLLTVACNSPMGGAEGASGGASTAANVAKNAATSPDAGTLTDMGPLRCAPSPGMLDACTGKAVGDGCTLSGKRDGGFSLPGSCRSTLLGSGLACVPTPPSPPTFLVDACSGKSSGVACTATGPGGPSFEGTCRTSPRSSTLFCGWSHSPPSAVVEACSGKSAGDACSRLKHHDGGSEPGICRSGPFDDGTLACRPASPPGALACDGLDAGATCSLGGGHWKHGEEGLTGSCVVPPMGGASTCVVACTELFHRFRHHRHGQGGGKHGPWWKHGPSDAGTAAP